MAAGLDAVVRLSEPDVLGALVRLAERAPRLEKLADLAASFDDHVAMATDIADAWIQENEGGDRLDARLVALKDTALAATRPAILESVARLVPLVAELDPLLGALSTALGEPSQPLGAFGLLGALRDPEVQRGVGRAVHLTRSLGRHETLPTKR